MPADIIIYALIAAGLVFWLRNILGTRHGDERERPNPIVPPPEKPDNIVALHSDPEMEELREQESAAHVISNLAQNPTGVLSIDNKDAENGLLDIAKADKKFDIKFFLQAAQDVFALVVESFAKGDRETLEDLLDKKVYEAFEPAITAREKRGETQITEIHAVRRAQVIEAGMDGRTARISVRFMADETSVTKNKNGDIIAGHPDKTTKMIDIWTFARDIKSRDPRWLVVETRGDFDEDNDLIPDSH